MASFWIIDVKIGIGTQRYPHGRIEVFGQSTCLHGKDSPSGINFTSVIKPMAGIPRTVLRAILEKESTHIDVPVILAQLCLVAHHKCFAESDKVVVAGILVIPR